jgi:transcriptional regulator
MYIPAHFAADEQTIRDLLTNMGAADLITTTEDGLVATFLPLLYDPDPGEHGALLGHLARNNDQWRRPTAGEALVIVHGPNGYVTPSWYASKAEHGRVVPTWNYVTVHVYGRMVIHDDPAWVERLVRRLTERHESGRERAWSVDDAPVAYIAGQMRAIVGIEILISRIEGKSKLSQNRPEADVNGVITGLEHDGHHRHADAIRVARSTPAATRGTPDAARRYHPDGHLAAGRRGSHLDRAPTAPSRGSL